MGREQILVGIDTDGGGVTKVCVGGNGSPPTHSWNPACPSLALVESGQVKFPHVSMAGKISAPPVILLQETIPWNYVFIRRWHQN